MKTGKVKFCVNSVPKTISWLLILLFLIIFASAFMPVWKQLVTSWSESDQYSHGFLIIPISVILIWKKKELLKKTKPLSDLKGLAIAIIALIMYFIAFLAEIKTLASLSMCVFIAGTVIYWWGFPVFKIIMFPLFLLLFMIPVPSQIFATLTIPLQLFVSKVSVLAAHLSGVPAFREGNIITIPGHNLQVVEACSGLRSIISLLMLSAIWGYIRIRANRFRLIVFLAGVPVAVFVNIVRVAVMIMALHFLNIDLSTGSIHIYWGMVIFLLALLFLFIITKVLIKWDAPIGKAS